MADINTLRGATAGQSGADAVENAKRLGIKVETKSNALDMTDFLYLMVQQFQNQTMDDTASTADMMNQLVQMSVVQAVTDITDATTLMYSASLVGKEVTLGQRNSDGKYEEIVGIVTGTGSLGGEQVIFVGDKPYRLSEIMAIGRLPEVEEDTDEDPDGDSDGDSGDKPEETPKT